MDKQTEKRGRGRPRKVVVEARKEMDIFDSIGIVAGWSPAERRLIQGSILLVESLEKAGWKQCQEKK